MVVFQCIFVPCILSFLFSNTGSRICPITSHFFGSKYILADSNPRNIFVAIFPSIRFDLPGIVSDSCIWTGICSDHAASPIATDPGHHFENTVIFAFFIFSPPSIFLAFQNPRMRKNGYRSDCHDLVVASLSVGIDWNAIFSIFAVFSS